MLLSKFNIRKRSHTVASTPTRTASSSSVADIDESFLELSKSVMRSEAKEDMIAFLLAYRRFGTASELFTIWIHLYKQLKNGHKSKMTKTMYERLLEFLHIWIQRYFPIDFTKKLTQELLEISSELEQTEQNQIKLFMLKGNELRKTHALHELGIERRMSDVSGSSSSEIAKLESLSVSPRKNTNEVDFCDYSVSDIAKALTMIEFEVFVKVFPTEFLTKVGWKSKSDKETSASHIQKLINRFNEVSFWVCTEILTRSGKHQLNALQKFISVARKCEKMNNFNCVMEILSGLNNSSVQRLKKLWSALPDKFTRKFEQLEEMMSAQHNFKAYTQAISERQPPALPYFPLFLRDFTFIVQGNSIILGDNKINFELIRLLGDRAESIRKYQLCPYKFVPDPAIVSFMKNLYYIEDDEVLYKLSLQSQPSMWVNVLAEASTNYSREEESSSSASYISDEEYHDSSSAHENEARISSDGMGSDPNDWVEPFPDRDSSLEVLPKITKEETSNISGPIGGKRTPRKKHKKNRRDQVRCNAVRVPRRFAVTFQEIEKTVDKHFALCRQSEEKGTIDIFEERYVVLRGTSLSREFVGEAARVLKLQENAAAEYSQKVIFDLGTILGRSDANMLKKKLNLKENIEKFAAGLVHFSYTGWGFVDMYSNSNLETDNILVHFNVSSSFEATSWLQTREKSKTPVCQGCAGYLSGLASECFEVQLTAAEVLCKAKGDRHCTFLLSPCDSIDEIVFEYCEEHNISELESQKINVCTFMETRYDKNYNIEEVTKKLEERLATPDKRSFLRTLSMFRPFSSSSNLETNKSDGKSEVVSVSNVLHRDNKQRYDLLTKTVQKSTHLFEELRCNPRAASVVFLSRPTERYVFTRVKAFTLDFAHILSQVFGPQKQEMASKFGKKLLFDVGRIVGASDERHLTIPTKPNEKSKTTEEKSFDEKMYTLSSSLAFSGFGKLEYSFSSKSQPNEDIFLNFSISSSCEADAWVTLSQKKEIQSKNNGVSKYPVCHFVSGYCCGWVGAVYNTQVVTLEVSCKAAGHRNCTFLTASPEKLEEHLRNFLTEQGRMEDIGYFTSTIHLFKYPVHNKS